MNALLEEFLASVAHYPLEAITVDKIYAAIGPYVLATDGYYEITRGFKTPDELVDEVVSEFKEATKGEVWKVFESMKPNIEKLIENDIRFLCSGWMGIAENYNEKQNPI